LSARTGVGTEKSEYSNEEYVIIGKGVDVERKQREGKKRFSVRRKETVETRTFSGNRGEKEGIMYTDRGRGRLYSVLC
jgi:hypothetical protein